MQVNVLSNIILALLLFPRLQSTSREHYTPGSEARPTITWLGSLGHAMHTPRPDLAIGGSKSILSHYALPGHYSRIRRYPDTKLFVGLIARELGHRIPPHSDKTNEPSVLVNNVCPGTVRTGADNNLPIWLRVPMNLNRAMRGRTVDEGARAVLWAARGGLHHGGQNGFYIADNEAQEYCHRIINKYTGFSLLTNSISSLAPFANTPEGRDFSTRLWEEIIYEGKKLDPTIGNGLKN